RGVADGIRNVDRRGPGADGELDGATEKVTFRSGRVFGAPLHVVGEIARPRHCRADGIEDGIRSHLELVLHMDGAGRDEGVNARTTRALQSLSGAIDVL